MEPDATRLSAPPTDFKRMLSWQLSSATEVTTKKKRKKKKRTRSTQEVVADSPTYSDDSDFECQFDAHNDSAKYVYTYVVVNSDGEEEVFFSAPESPICSDGCSDSDEGIPPTTSIIGVQQTSTSLGRKKSKSKKQKKKTRCLAKMAEAEFFHPLCQLVEDELSVQVGDMDVSSRTEVPSLVELCLMRTHRDDIDTAQDMPYLLHLLLGHDRFQNSVVATHIRWIERTLATQFLISELEHDNTEDCVYQSPWVIAVDIPDGRTGPHVPLPLKPAAYSLLDMILGLRLRLKVYLTGPLLHLVNLLFPLFSERSQTKVQRSEATELLTPAQMNAIHYVNSFVKSRYKELGEVMVDVLKVWPGYVYWARGQVKLAAVAFKTSIELLEQANSKALILNEMGRMFSQFGERELACKFFRDGAAIVVNERIGTTTNPYPLDPDMIEPSALALEAATYDCGILTTPTARNAARLWKTVVSIMDSLPETKTNFWVLHLAAGESKMLAHSGKVTGADPSHPLNKDVLGSDVHDSHYLEECRELMIRLADKQKILCYHLSLVHAMFGHRESSRRAWQEFMDMFMQLREFEDGAELPFHMFNPTVPIVWLPWEPLLDLLKAQSLKVAPVIKLQWRMQLMNPHYPYYYRLGPMSVLADHCSQSINIRLTQDGYITADWHMDTPPMRSVFLNPFTGSLCFPRQASKRYFYRRPIDLCLKGRDKERGALPWPTRVFESDKCVVELVAMTTQDHHYNSYYGKKASSYSCCLHFYDIHSCRGKLDLRKMIRKKLKQVILEKIKGTDLEDKEELLEKLMESGRTVQMKSLRQPFQPKYTTKQDKKDKKKTHKVLNNNVDNFTLQLLSAVAYGDSSLLLSFCMDPNLNEDSIDTLVFVNCSSMETFLNPRIYCEWGYEDAAYQMVSPSTEISVAYDNHHLKHVKYLTAVHSVKKCSPVAYAHTFLVFDQNGDIVSTKAFPSETRRPRQFTITEVDCPLFVVGHRLFGLKKEPVQVYSCDLHCEEYITSLPISTTSITSVSAVPGLLFVHTLNGLSLLHPCTLAPVDIVGLQVDQCRSLSGSSKENLSYQFKVQESLFSVLRVWDVGHADSPEDVYETVSCSSQNDVPISSLSEKSQDNFKITQDLSENAEAVGTVRSCCVGFSVNNRLVVLSVEGGRKVIKCLLDVKLPGNPTELHPMGPSGNLVNTTNFLDNFRQEVYWLSVTGRLKGVLPCLGAGPRSFFSVTFDPKQTDSGMVEGCSDGGLFVYLNDGQGALACAKLSD